MRSQRVLNKAWALLLVFNFTFMHSADGASTVFQAADTAELISVLDLVEKIDTGSPYFAHQITVLLHPDT